MRRLLLAVMAIVCLTATLSLPATARAADPVKVAIIVGPVGSLTPTYLALAEAAAAAAERHGASVARAYSPNATPGNVLAAVEGARVVIYFGHGYGHPSPYGGLNTARQNGWALQGPAARGTHGDSLGGEMTYYGEDWIVANARPAPGFVMIYSNTCYAPGASEGGFAPATPSVAASRVAHYSRSVFAMGGSAYFATDFDRGAADLVARLLSNPAATYANAFTADSRYVPSALTTQPHHFHANQQIWLHRSKYTDGPPNYWYAFAGNPDLAPMRAWDRVAPRAALLAPKPDAVGVAPGASVQVRFDEPVRGVDPEALRLVDGSGDALAATVTYDDESRTATVKPAQPLPMSARLSVVLGDGVHDAAGNRVAAATWSFGTRLDADPRTESLRVTLEPGAHTLVKLGAGGSIATSRELEATEPRFLSATRRARLPGQTGSWLELNGDGVTGWWVAESVLAHAAGVTEEALLADDASVELMPGDRPIHALESGQAQLAGELAIDVGQSVSVDRRKVVDGRTFLRLAETVFVGRWIEVAPGSVDTEPGSSRLLAAQPRPTATVVAGAGEWTAFLFDGAGRVGDRRQVEPTELESLRSSELLEVAGGTFHRIDGGPLDGWALPDDPRLQLVPIPLGARRDG